MEVVVFILSAIIIVVGAVGVVVRTHPVHCALSMIMTLFGVAVLFLAMDAQFLAAVQVIVYAGAIVVLFLFVIMLLGVDKAESLRVDPLRGQRPAAAVLGVATLGLTLAAIFLGGHRRITGLKTGNPVPGGEQNIKALAESLFSDHVFAFEATSVLLVIAVVGTVLLARRPPTQIDVSEFADATPETVVEPTDTLVES
jgi:NADH-quinone oxidoreductase subunit J